MRLSFSLCSRWLKATRLSGIGWRCKRQNTSHWVCHSSWCHDGCRYYITRYAESPRWSQQSNNKTCTLLLLLKVFLCTCRGWLRQSRLFECAYRLQKKCQASALECPFSVVRWRAVVMDINTQYLSAKCRSRRVVQNCGFKHRRAVRITRTLQRLDDIQQEQNEATVSKWDFAVEINALLVGNISEVST